MISYCCVFPSNCILGIFIAIVIDKITAYQLVNENDKFIKPFLFLRKLFHQINHIQLPDEHVFQNVFSFHQIRILQTQQTKKIKIGVPSRKLL